MRSGQVFSCAFLPKLNAIPPHNAGIRPPPFRKRNFGSMTDSSWSRGRKALICCLAGVLLPFAVSAAESSGSVSTDVAFLWRNYRMECQAVIGFFVLFFLLLIGMVVYMIRFRAVIHRRRQDEREFRRRIYLERDRSNQALLTLEQTAKMANLAYFSCRADGSELTLSAGANRNWPLEDSKAVPPSQWVYPEDLASFEASWQELTQGRSPEIEISFRAGKGGARYFRLQAGARGVAEEGERRIVGCIQEVTDLRERERKFRDTDELLKIMADTLPCPIFIKDASDGFRYLLSNRSHAALLNRTPEEVAGRTDAEIFGPGHEYVERFRKADREALEAGRNLESVERVVDAQGKVHYLHGIKGIVTQSGGRKLLIGMATEVTELEETKQRAEESKRLLQAILDHVPVGILLKDPAADYRYVLWNRALSEFSGVPVEQVLGKNDFEANIYPGCAEQFRREDAKVVATGKAEVFVEDLQTVRDTRVVYHTHKIPLELEPGKTFLLGLCVDISREWKLENEQNRMIDALNDFVRNEQMLNRCLKTITVENDFETAVNEILKRVGENRGADRCFIFRYSDNYRVGDNCFEWVREGIAPQKRDLRDFEVERVQKLHRLIVERRIIAVNDLAQEPEIREELAAWLGKEPDVKSLLISEIREGGQLWGVFGLDFVRERHAITAADRETLRSAGNLFMLARERQRQMELVADTVALQKQLVENIDIPLAIFDLDYNIISINSAAAEDVPIGELIGKKCYSSLCGCAEPPSWCPHARVRLSGRSEQVDFTLKGRNLHLTSQPIFDRDGKIRHIFEAAVDMTDAQRQNETLAENRNRLLESNNLLKICIEQDETVNACMEMLVLNSDFRDSLQHIVSRIGERLGSDTCGVFRAVDGKEKFAVEEYWVAGGLSPKLMVRELVRRDYPACFEELFHGRMLKVALKGEDGEEETPVQREMRNYLRGQKFSAIFCIGVWCRGEYWGHLGVEWSDAGSMFNEVGERMVRAAARIIEILIERELGRKTLVRSESEKTLVFNMLDIPLILFDAQNRVVRVNAAAEKLAGRSRAKILAEPCYRSFCRRENPPPDCMVRLTLQTGLPQQGEAQILGKTYQVASRPLFEEGKLVNVLQSFVDMTEARQQSEKLKAAMESAQAADRAKSFFLATMSHEIRTPLNAVIGFSELLQNQSLSPEEQVEYLHSINLAGTALLRLINDILDLSKIEAGEVRIVAEKIDFTALCGEINAIFTQKVMEKKLYFKLEVPSGLPFLWLDGQRMRQVLLNLVGNAVKFTGEGGVTLKVEFRREGPEAGTLEIAIIDTGIGISREYQQKVFQPFIQDNAVRDRAYEGTGLGLSISQRLIRKMDGRLLLESEPGRGSCFTVVLEHVRYEEGAPEQAGAVSGKEKASMVFARPLLLVDDVPMNLKVLGAMLRKLDVPYLACASGAEALELAAKELPCVILTDLWMPGMNGGELAERLAGDPVLREIPVIAVTADSQIDPKLEGLFDGVLLKPISLDGLRKLLNGLPVKRTAIDC